MKEPDKLYVEIDNKAHVYFGLQPESAVEYIRKDALMKWLKLEKDISFPEDYERGCIDGRNGLREELIDKLNSI